MTDTMTAAPAGTPAEAPAGLLREAPARRERVGENLNRALHQVLEAHDDAFLIGEDVLDPYGGAFNIAKGLSDRFGDRVLTTPISENAILGIANGLALTGNRPIAEMMFGDFITLAFDQIVNFSAKSVTMYGTRHPMHLVVRCPVGGRRGYGPTHSQSPQKHFLGVPDLHLFELSPFHDSGPVLEGMVELGAPCIFFEDKVLYTERTQLPGTGPVAGLFALDMVGDDPFPVARLRVDGVDEPDVVLIAPGGLAHRAVEAARDLFLTEEIACEIYVPTRLYPFDAELLAGPVARAGRVCVVEDAPPGGSWGAEVAQQLHSRCWGSLKAPVRLVHSADAVIPTALHLEQDVLVSSESLGLALRETAR
ncbi:alpha-ketoacid dehydrogenase subunit beta [Streptomyces sp. NPDC059070]|uniref:alpha-ketoacid dehydrogenase subunit beta n=1 Tax=unclassified Streptomyces TaxID=2593676 RepID=UPI0034E19E0E